MWSGFGEVLQKASKWFPSLIVEGDYNRQEGAEKGSLEPEHGVSAGSDGKSERPRDWKSMQVPDSPRFK